MVLIQNKENNNKIYVKSKFGDRVTYLTGKVGIGNGAWVAVCSFPFLSGANLHAENRHIITVHVGKVWWAGAVWSKRVSLFNSGV